MNANLADRINAISPPPPTGLQLDLFATIIRLERIRAALDNGDELEALRLTRFGLLQDDITRLNTHITDQTWQWAVRAAGDVPGFTAWLGYIAADLDRARTRPPHRRGRFGRGGRHG